MGTRPLTAQMRSQAVILITQHLSADSKQQVPGNIRPPDPLRLFVKPREVTRSFLAPQCGT